MATEAQRLMMMSLGKIQGCRQRRGGINLHKSLLVTKILHKARSIAISENVASKKEEDTEDQMVPEMDIKEEESQQQSPATTPTTTPSMPEPVLLNCHEEEEEESPSEAGNPDLDASHEVTKDISEYQDKENVNNNIIPQNYPIKQSEDFEDSTEKDSNCTRCAKRRLTEVEAAVESISPKKQRTGDSDYEEYKNTPEPMQVETTQISNLVNRFSSGFTGLLTSDSDSTTQSHEAGPASSQSTEVQGHSDSLLSCSTQIKESFELLARPIALSV